MTTTGRVAIIGAGPAGCAAAMTLASRGVPTVLMERGTPQKDKPCGDAYLPDALALMDRLGIVGAFGEDFRARSFDRIELWDATRRIWTLGLDGQHGWIAPRAGIDQILRDAAARVSDVRYDTFVSSVTRSLSGWHLEGRSPSGMPWEEDYAAVILATGAANALSRHYGISGNPQTGASISAYALVEGITSPLFQFAPMGIPGYGWVFPLSGGMVNIGVCAATHAPNKLRQATSRYMDQWGATERGPLRAGAGPMWSHHGSRWHSAEGLVSCGDAAGLVDPLTGEGIAPALESGIHAGQAVARYLESGAAADLAAYSDWVRKTFATRYGNTPVRRLWRRLNGVTGLTEGRRHDLVSETP